MKVALVHDYLLQIGEEERVLLELNKLFPEAPIYTILYDKEKMPPWFGVKNIRVSFLQKFPGFLKRRQKHLLPFVPSAAESFDLREFDLVISSSSGFAKSVITRPGALHICYCHAPSRFLWDYSREYLKDWNMGFLRKTLAKCLFHYLRVWDNSSAVRADYFIANSRATAAKIEKYYRRQAFVIYPPVKLPEFDYWGQVAREGEYFLVVSRLEARQRVDLIVEAFNKLKLSLVVIGEGPGLKKLKKSAGENIKIIETQDEKEKNNYLRNCTALVCASEEDFGAAAIEAMGWGKPVLAYRAGASLETVLEGVSGEFFDEPTAEILADGVRRLRNNLPKYSALVIRKWAEKFSEEKFKQEFMDFVKKLDYNRN